MKGKKGVWHWFWLFAAIAAICLGLYFLLKGSMSMDNITNTTRLP